VQVQLKPFTEPIDQAWLAKILDSNQENILKKLETNPESISEDLYSMLLAIFFN
jgi:hypothetical protein